jgi:hypothetical protein
MFVWTNAADLNKATVISGGGAALVGLMIDRHH